MSSRDARGGLVAVAALLLGLCSVSGQAELGGDDYLPSGPGLDAAERARVREEIEAERRRAAEHAEQAARERAAEQARRQAALAAETERKPKGERLIEAHCLACHDPEAIGEVLHSWLGWQLTVLRMRIFNGAVIPPSKAQSIVAHLAKIQGAGARQAAIEYGLTLTILGLPATATTYLLIRRRRTRRRDRLSGSSNGRLGSMP